MPVEVTIPNNEPTIPNSNETISYKKIMFVASMALGSIALYAQATRDRPDEDIMSGLLSNFMINFYAAYVSVNYLLSLVAAKKYRELAAILPPALILAAVQGLITKLESKNEALWLQYVSAVCTMAGMSVLYALSLKNLAGLPQYVKNMGRKDLANLSALSTVLRVVDYKSMPDDVSAHLASATDDQEKYLRALQAVMKLAQQVKKPAELNAFLDAMITLVGFIPKMALSTFMIFCMFAYSCAAAVSMEKDFNAPPLVAAINGFLLMSPVMVLSITGGFALGAAFNSIIADLIQYHTISNDFKLGKAGIAATLLSPILATIIGCRSGDTTQILLGQCKNTLLRFFSDFSVAPQVAYDSSAGFNTVYAEKMIALALQHFAKRYMGAKELNHLALKKVWDDMVSQAEKDPKFFETLFSANNKAVRSENDAPVPDDSSPLTPTVFNLTSRDFNNRLFVQRDPSAGEREPLMNSSVNSSPFLQPV